MSRVAIQRCSIHGTPSLGNKAHCNLCENPPVLSAIVQGANTLLGFPLVITRKVPQGEARLYMPEDVGNQTGELEIHLNSFVAVEGSELRLYFRGQLLTTIEWTNDVEQKQRDIKSELEKFLDEGKPAN